MCVVVSSNTILVKWVQEMIFIEPEGKTEIVASIAFLVPQKSVTYQEADNFLYFLIPSSIGKPKLITENILDPNHPHSRFWVHANRKDAMGEIRQFIVTDDMLMLGFRNLGDTYEPAMPYTIDPNIKQNFSVWPDDEVLLQMQNANVPIIPYYLVKGDNLKPGAFVLRFSYEIPTPSVGTERVYQIRGPLAVEKIVRASIDSITHQNTLRLFEDFYFKVFKLDHLQTPQYDILAFCNTQRGWAFNFGETPDKFRSIRPIFPYFWINHQEHPELPLSVRNFTPPKQEASFELFISAVQHNFCEIHPKVWNMIDNGELKLT
jgi:hypothetical protein